MLKRFFKATLPALVVVAATAGTAHAAGTFCSSGKTVHFAGITWESGAFATEVLRQILEKGYGCATDVVPGSTAATETALAQQRRAGLGRAMDRPQRDHIEGGRCRARSNWSATRCRAARRRAGSCPNT